MKRKIKLLVSSVSVMMMTVPVMALAQFEVPSDGKAGDLPVASITEIITAVMNWILGLVGILGVIGFAIAGILYLTAAGDDNRIQTAKNAMMYSIIGVVVALVGLVAIQAIETILGGGSDA